MIVSEAAATGDEAKVIRKLVLECVEKAAKQGRLPKQVHRDFGLEFGEDSAGDPAVWIWFPVDDDRLSREEIEQVAELTDSIQREVLQSQGRHWPYVVYGQRK